MEHADALREQLFSRGASPPFQSGLANQGQSHSSSPLNPVDSLFQGIGGGSASVNPPHYSAPATPDVGDDLTPGAFADRQGALLSLLGSVPMSSGANSQQQSYLSSGTTNATSLPDLVSNQLPSSSSSAPGPTTQESQGKLLLEQLMSG